MSSQDEKVFKRRNNVCMQFKHSKTLLFFVRGFETSSQDAKGATNESAYTTIERCTGWGEHELLLFLCRAASAQILCHIVTHPTLSKYKQYNWAGASYYARNGSCVGSDMYTYTRAETELCIDSLNVEGGKDSALWLLRGDSHRLFL